MPRYNFDMSNVERIAAALSLDGVGGDARAGFALAGGAGYSGVAIATNHAELSPEALSDSGRRHVKKILESSQMNVAAVRAAGPRGGLMDPAGIDRMVGNVRKAMKLAADLSASTVTLHAGSMSAAGVAGGAAALKELAQEAEHAGLTLAVSGDASDKLLAMLADTGCENATLNMSPAAAIGAGEDAVKLLQSLRKLPGALTAADAIKAGKQLRLVTMGEGQVPWEEVFAVLREQDFRGPTIVDVRDLTDSPAGAIDAAAYLRRFLRR
jgi:sugar phosphate isomerase/epimerase